MNKVLGCEEDKNRTLLKINMRISGAPVRLNDPRPEPLSLPFPPQAGSPMGVTSATDIPLTYSQMLTTSSHKIAKANMA